jgi:outer membrane receptor protein involved in Fe transport
MRITSFRFSHVATLMCGTASIFIAAPAIADAAASEAAPQASNAATERPANDEIVVTAERRSERLIDTPQSLSALSAADLSKLNATKFIDYANTVPGLQFVTQGVGRTQINLRGVTTGTDPSSTVGIYVDDVPFGSSTRFAVGNQLTLDAGLFDLDRIEVLRGPQGTLYGASSIGGLIKYVTTAPSLTEFGGMAEGSVSTTHDGGIGYSGNLVVNIPVITDKVAIRASGFYSHDGGYVGNVETGQKNVDQAKVYGARVDVLLKPTDDLSLRLTGFGQNIRRDGALYSGYDRVTREPIDGSLDQAHPVEEPFDQNFRLVSGTINYDFGGVKLTSITSYQTNKTFVIQDLTSVEGPFLSPLFPNLVGVGAENRVSTKKFTQEVRLSTQIAKTFDLITGAFYTHEKSNVQQSFPLFDASNNIIPFVLFDGQTPTIYREYAVFGDLTWHITDKFDVTGGVRYARNNQRFEQIATGLLGSSLSPEKSKEGVVTYLANARYHFSPNVMAYARFATGYRPGGPNTVVRDPATGVLEAPTSVKSDTLQSYEGGLKAETSDHSLSIDVSGFYIDWKNIQIGTAVDGIAEYLNAGTAHIKGAELTLIARPDTGLIFTGNFSYNDGFLTQANAVLGAAKGEQLPNTAHFTAALTGDYTLNSSSLKPTIGATLRYVGKRTTSFDDNVGLPNYRLPDYVSTDLRAGVVVGPVEAQVFVHNLFDVRAQLSATTIDGPTVAEVAIMQPRTIGISATTRF